LLKVKDIIAPESMEKQLDIVACKHSERHLVERFSWRGWMRLRRSGELDLDLTARKERRRKEF